jgi:hypothetical protein
MADVMPCETCSGKRFKKEVLEVAFEGKNIHDIPMMTIDDAIAFFIAHKQAKITQNYNHYKMLFGICAIRTVLLYTFRWRSTTYKTPLHSW